MRGRALVSLMALGALGLVGCPDPTGGGRLNGGCRDYEPVCLGGQEVCEQQGECTVCTCVSPASRQQTYRSGAFPDGPPGSGSLLPPR